MRLHVVITTYNNAPWYERCLESIAIQRGAYDCLVIDDVTDDGSEGALRALCQALGFRHVRNEENLGKVGNLWTHLHRLKAGTEDPILLVDGDDFLAHDGVVERLIEVYEDDWTWLTYGQYDPWPHNNGQNLAEMYPSDVIRDRTFRSCGMNLFNHPLTFRYGLFQHLKEADLRASTGDWFHGGEDFVLMAPFLELATPGGGLNPHWRMLTDVLYRYNAINPLSEVEVKLDKIVESREIHAWQRKRALRQL